MEAVLFSDSQQILRVEAMIEIRWLADRQLAGEGTHPDDKVILFFCSQQR